MSECDDPAQLCRFPTELLIHIFTKLSAFNVIKCRLVCRRWKEVIDFLVSNDSFWKTKCFSDFEVLAKEIKNKSITPWFEIYKSVSLWSRLADTVEFKDEFSHSSICADEVRDVYVKNDTVSVQKRSSLVFYDLKTLERTNRNPIYGDFARIIDYDDDASVKLNTRLDLIIARKPKKGRSQTGDNSTSAGYCQKDEEVTFYNTKYFITFNRDVYFVNTNNEIYHCNIDGDLTATRLRYDDTVNVVALSYHNGTLNILTQNRNVFAYQNNKFVKLFNLESKKENLFDCLWQYQFLDTIDWRIFYIWLMALEIRYPEGPLKYICVVKIYGDVFLIGCRTGAMLIYYKPYVNGQLDFYSHEPIKSYLFTERFDIPVLSCQPVIGFDIVEIKEGHKIFVAMPKKIIVLTYKHYVEVVQSKAVVPYVHPGPVVLKV